MNIRMLRTMVGGAALTIALVGCSIKHEKIEESIKSTVKDKGLTMKSVSCPEGQKATVGNKFTCDGETSDGHKLKFAVEVTSTSGDIKWELSGKILDLEKLEKSIAKKVGKKAELDCADQNLVVNKGDTVDCEVEIDGETQKVEIKAKDDKGNVEWKIKGAASGGDDDDDDDDKKKKKKGDDDDDE